METLLTVVVDRSRWIRGEGEARSLLLRSSDEKMCCLGFACLAAGHTEEEIRDVATPNGLGIHRKGGRVLLPNYKHEQISSVMDVNDGPYTADPDREEFIIEHLAQIGITMSFVDGPHFPNPAECARRGLGPHVRAPLDAQCIHCQDRLEVRGGLWQAVTTIGNTKLR